MDKEIKDIELICTCGKPFIWSAGEQIFMNDLLQKGKLNEEQPDGTIRPGRILTPKRCKDCRMKKKQERGFR